MRPITIATTCCLAAFAGGCVDDSEPQPEPPFLPRTCAEIKDAVPSAADGTHRLFVDGDEQRPFIAYCDGMGADQTPVEYLELPRTIQDDPSQGAGNVSMVYLNVSGDDGANSRLWTYYKRVRIDPLTLRVDIGDARHALTLIGSPEGVVQHDWLGSEEITHVAFASAIVCRDAGTIDPLANVHSQVDLTGTGFELVTVPGSSAPFAPPSGGALVDVSPSGASLVPSNAMGVCSKLGPVGHNERLVNTTPGSAGTLPLQYVGGL